MVSQSGTVQESKTTSATPLSRSGSLYNLTLDEVQNHLGNLGKPLGSMNLDELLKSVWSVEAGEVSDFGRDGAANMQQNQLSEMNRQGSLSLTLSGDISKKTVDEVWEDMQVKKRGVDGDREARERQQTLGEMTLEDFLVKAGVVGESFHNKEGGDLLSVDSNEDSRQNVSHHGHHWMQFQLPSTQQPPQHQHEKHLMSSFMAVHAIQQPFQVARNPVLDAAMSRSSLMDTQTLGRKRVASGIVVEKTVERRQKRMIKNRESAARSRARRQAYTQELELKVSRLEEENERLRRQNEIEKEVPCVPPPEPKNQLRRTNSASF